jgi:predicted Rossmann-fold nucleotide-binding protein
LQELKKPFTKKFMESYLLLDHYDLVTPDGKITQLKRIDERTALATVVIENISQGFVGFKIDRNRVFFNLKSTLAQLGVDGIGKNYLLESKICQATVEVELRAIDHLGIKMLGTLTEGAYIGKLFAADERRRVRDPDYLFRMFGRSDRYGDPLLSLGGLAGSENMILEKLNGRTVAFLSLKQGCFTHDPVIEGFLPIVAKALKYPKFPLRSLLEMHQVWDFSAERSVQKEKLLLVKTLPLHVRTVFARVVDDLLPKGFSHTSASVLEPTTRASGDIYELYGSSKETIDHIPLEFYTLEPHREHVFFSDRDQLQAALENEEAIFNVFETAPKDPSVRCAVFVVKGEQLYNLKPEDWIAREAQFSEFPGLIHPTRQALLIQKYIRQQPSYQFLKSIEDGLITSQGVLFCRHFPSPLMKQMMLSENMQKFLKRIYFESPSQNHGDFFSHEDRSFLLDLAKFAIAVYWVDKTTRTVLKYVPRPEKDAGLFVPQNMTDAFSKATFFGIYGSHLITGEFEQELSKLIEGILMMREEMTHPLLHKNTPVALVTGGGPGAMEVGNRVARNLNILSCANIVDFSGSRMTLNEQIQNPYIDGKMTYRLDRLVERQAEFHLDFPIFLMGGIGTDFEQTLEEVRRKVGDTRVITPILLFGNKEYWKSKITERFQCNLKTQTITGSEWISNCFYCIQTASQGLKIYRDFFHGTLPIGKEGPIYPDGFAMSN